MKTKIKYYKIFISFILLTIYIFMFNSSISYARTVSFSLHDGLVTTIKDNISTDDEEEKEDEENKDDEANNGEDEENTDEDIEEIDKNQIVKNGVYFISCAKNTDYVLDIYGNSLDWGGNLQICSRNGGANQKFYITYEGNGYYKIASIGSALIIDVKDGVKENGANIQQWEDNGADAQRFKIVKNDDDTYSFIAKCSDKAIDVNGGIFKEGTNVQQWDFINSDAQKFKLEETEFINDNEIVSIKKASNNKYALDIDNNSSANGTVLQLYEVNNTFAQRFELERVAKNEIRIRTVSSGGWLTETGTTNGSNIVQNGNSKTPIEDANTWILEWDGGILLKNKESNLYIDVDSNISENKQKVQVYEKNNNPSQKFIINREHLINDGWYEINSALGNNVDLDHGKSDWGVNILAWQKNDQNNQKFRFTYTDSGYKISTIYDLAVEVIESKTTNGANVQQWEDNGALCQRWLPVVVDGGYVKLKNANSKKYLDIENESAANGANIIQYEEKDSQSQNWKIVPTGIVSGWFKMNGDMYCVDPATNQLVKNCTRVDPTMTDPSQFGSIYDFDENGRATWHLPTFEDLPGGHGKSAPIPTPMGDERQRTLLYALSRVGCEYKLFEAPTGFVCDGLIAWSFTNATGKRFRTDNTAIDDQDMSYQYNYITKLNGIQTDISNAKPGDIIFWGDPAVIGNNATHGSRHVSIYYYGDYMIHAADVSHGVCIGNFSTDQNAFRDFIGFGSPYVDTSKCEIPNIFN